jgi:hypothetical protein
VVNRVFSRARALKIKGISGDFYEKKRGKRGIFLWFFLLRKGFISLPKIRLLEIKEHQKL